MFNFPHGVAVDEDGTALYVADSNNHRIRTIRNNQVSTIAGNGDQGFADGATAEASFSRPTGVAVDRDGVVYVADRLNNRIRMIRGQVSTLAGNGTKGFADGAAHQSTFWLPFGVAVDLSGSIYVADAENNRIRKLDNGHVVTMAGGGSYGVANGAGPAALFTYPSGVVVDQNGTIYVADTNNDLIRMIRNGEVSTLAGTGERGFADGPSHLSAFRLPCGIAVDLHGHVYVADQGNNRIRMIRDGQVSTLAGNGTEGFADGPAAQAMFRTPCGVSVDRGGNVYVADTFNHCIRMIHDGQVSTLAGGQRKGFADGPTLIPMPAMSLPDHSTKLERAIGVSTDFTLQVNTTQLELHRSFINLRCPMLLKSPLRVKPVDQHSIDLFKKFLYTDRMPEDNLPPMQLMGLSYLMSAAGMKSHAFLLLHRLQKFSIAAIQAQQTVSIQDLVQLYCYSLDLSPFAVGQKVAVYLLQKHIELLRPHMKSLPQWLGKHSDKLMDLVQEFVAPVDSVAAPITSQMIPTKGNFLPLADTLVKLYSERHKADFEITIKKTDICEKVHSYVMYAMWPYFRHMYDANTKEKQQHRLELPAVGEDGGMSPQILQLIIEMCYKPGMKELRQRVSDAATAMQILSISNLYLVNHDDDTEGTFEGLLALAQRQIISGINADVCIDVFKQASVLGLEDVVKSARKVIFANIKALFSNPVHHDELRSLSKDMMFDLLSGLQSVKDVIV